jgi:putative restriction endonuclease
VITRNKGLPLRVIRKVAEGYRYDGLYRVADAWHERGRSGKRVWRYRLIALEPGGTASEDGAAPESPHEDGGGQAATLKRTGTVTRVIRDTKKSREVKKR